MNLALEDGECCGVTTSRGCRERACRRRAIIMKRFFYSGLAFLILALLSMPATAQARSHRNAVVHGRFSRHATVSRHAKSNDRSNKGGRVRGRERAEEVH